MRICQMTVQIAVGHSGASFGRYTATNLIICGSAGRSRPRLLGKEGPRPFGDAGPAFACQPCSNPCLSLVLFLFLPMVSMEETPWGSHPGLNESESFCLLIGQIPQVSGCVTTKICPILFTCMRTRYRTHRFCNAHDPANQRVRVAI